MRVIAGKYKRTPLMTLDGLTTRPTRDMVKEALFSSIDINEETVFLDLFSGSGAIGIEALSRGAKEVIFNDINKDAYNIIRTNLNKIHEVRTVYNLSYNECLDAVHDICFDYVYLDPPYAFRDFENIFSKLSMKDGGSIIVEIRKDTDLKDEYGPYKFYKEKRYGINKLRYYRGN